MLAVKDGVVILRALAVAVGLFWATHGQAQFVQPAYASPIGGNIEGIADWSYSNPFADLMKQARAFGSPSTPWDGVASLDANGWPTTDAGVILGTWPGMSFVGGTYNFSLESAATPTISLVASPGTIVNVSRSATGVVTGQIIYPGNGTQLMLSFTNTQGGFRNLQVMRPGCTFGQIFTPTFLHYARELPTLRFMDWDQTNGNTTVTWASRPQPSTPSYAWNGVPWEVDIQLCNTVGANAWINVPAEADDEYITQLAQLFKANLRPDLKVYVEYSNEVWNWGFQQAQWNLQQAVAEGPTGELNYDGCNNQGYWAARRIGRQIAHISTIFQSIYGTSYATTVRPVLATQYAWPDLWLVQALQFISDRRGAPNTFLSAVAVAPYFNLGADQSKDGLTTTRLLQDMSASVSAFSTDINLERSASLAKFYGLTLVAYESGPDVSSTGSLAQKAASQMDPRMQAICQQYYAEWFGAGGSLINWFVMGASGYGSQYGDWGMSDDMAKLAAAPKHEALLAAQANTFTLTRGIQIPAMIDAREHTDRSPTWASGPEMQISTTDWQGPSRDYYVRCAADHQGYIALIGHTSVPNFQAEILVDGIKVGNLLVPQAAVNSYTHALAFHFTVGFHTIRLKAVTAGGPMAIQTLSAQ